MKDDYATRFARYESELAEYNAKADMLVEEERTLVEQSNEDEAHRRVLLARYDAALETQDEAGIAAYNEGWKTLHDRFLRRRAALESVRAKYQALTRERPRRPRRTWREIFGIK